MTTKNQGSKLAQRAIIAALSAGMTMFLALNAYKGILPNSPILYLTVGLFLLSLLFTFKKDIKWQFGSFIAGFFLIAFAIPLFLV